MRVGDGQRSQRLGLVKGHRAGLTLPVVGSSVDRQAVLSSTWVIMGKHCLELCPLR